MNFFGVLVKTADASIGHVDVEAPEAPMDDSGPPPGDPESSQTRHHSRSPRHEALRPGGETELNQPNRIRI